MPKLTLDALRTSILPLILSMREDLRAIGFDRPENRAQFRQWLLNHGIEEYPALREMLLELVGQGHGLARAGPCPFGVNLVGYAFGQLGIGEDVRMAGQALLAADVPMTMINFKPGDDIPQNDHSMAMHVSNDAQYAVNIFCMTAQENGRQFLEEKSNLYAGRYNIGYWPWELSTWPHDWKLSFDLVDEVWVSTRHTYASLADICPKPLIHMPMAVELSAVKAFRSRAAARKHFGLPTQAVLFCFSFDLNSSIHRKNPQACVEAFLNAFPPGGLTATDVGLVIKVHQPKPSDKAWRRLKRLASQDARIHIIEGTLPRPDLLALYKACDCFLSLHRAEGFGRGIAEALQLGMHVIATGYSGNVDFCEPPHSDLVNYRLIPIVPGQYPYGEGQVWAEPDVGHAAQLMRAFFERRQQVSRAHAPRADGSRFSASVVGQRYRARLEQIQTENPHLFAQPSRPASRQRVSFEP